MATHVAKKIKIVIERNSSSSSDWSNLPDDMICLIGNRLHFVDHLSFRAVCKNWRRALKQNKGFIKYADQLPWMVGIDAHSHKHNSFLFLYDPFYKRKYTVRPSTTGLFENKRTKVLDAKNGWILVAQGPDFTWNTNSLFLYAPFTDKIIPLPDLGMKHNNKGTFTMLPDDGDCEIFVLRAKQKKVSISICRRRLLGSGCGDWIEYWFDIEEFEKTTQRGYYSFLPDGDVICRDGDVICGDILYLQGVVYCSLGLSVIGAFNVSLKQWKILPYPHIDDRHFVYSDYLIDFGLGRDSNNSLLIAQPEYYSRTHILHRFDLSQMKWSQVDNNSGLLKDKSLFLGYHHCTSLLLQVEDEDYARDFMNTIHSYVYWQEKCPQISEFYAGRLEQHTWIQPPSPTDFH